MVLINGLSRFEIRVLTLAAFGLTLCGFLLSSEAVMDRLFSRAESSLLPRVRLGRVENVVGQVMLKGTDTEGAVPAESGRELFLGDAVHTGEKSRMSWRDLNGVRVFALENSFFRLDQFTEGNLVSMDMGRFRVQLDGEWTAAIGSDPVRFVGQGAELEIDVKEDGTYSYKVVSGEGFVSKLNEANSAAPTVIAGDSIQIYLWKFSDLYVNQSETLRRRSETGHEVKMERTLFWDHPQPGPFSIQIDTRPDFADGRAFLTAHGKNLKLQHLSLGENFWRVSFDRRRWSDVGQFTVESHYLDARAEVRVLRTAGQTVELGFKSGSEGINSFVLEISPNERFDPESTEIRVSETGTLLHAFAKAGRYFVRARAMNELQEVSELSTVVPVEVVALRSPASK